MTAPDRPRAWIGSLAAYNGAHDGVPRLIGDWYDATDAADVTVADLHAGTVVPFTDDDELYVLDLDGEWPVHREMDPTEAQRWGEIYEEVGPNTWPALCAWVRSGAYIAEGDTDFPILSDFEERYAGEWSTFREYAEQLADDIGLLTDVPESLQRYFDWESWTRDLRFDYSVEDAPDGGVFIFRDL
ncbi:antirestriction protein [Gordonia sihwensis]|nr:antirestriction protein [Gordonia sihwensis]